ncbi:MAG: hypothetical protein KKD28_13400 [Chloroflexi bacterium]|nr:hypothetical protein [Chloroflexota bacterium]MBU1662457.1 hypothetical protein [Chloroflexota bacterium]
MVERIEQAAAKQGITSDEMLTTAVNELLDKVARQKIRAESQAFKEMYMDLTTNYMGQYVAVHNGKVIDHDEDGRTLYLRIREQYGNIAILIRQVTDKTERKLVFRSLRV